MNVDMDPQIAMQQAEGIRMASITDSLKDATPEHAVVILRDAIALCKSQAGRLEKIQQELEGVRVDYEDLKQTSCDAEEEAAKTAKTLELAAADAKAQVDTLLLVAEDQQTRAKRQRTFCGCLLLFTNILSLCDLWAGVLDGVGSVCFSIASLVTEGTEPHVVNTGIFAAFSLLAVLRGVWILFHISHRCYQLPRQRPSLGIMLVRFINASLKPLLIFCLTIMAISTANWVGIQFMATHCARWGWLGPAQNILSLVSPPCQFVNRFQVKLATYYNTIWVSAASATMTWITSRYTVAGLTAAAATNIN